jgi:hydroxyethylthiazole kinase-like uncharacterized protein yjeF
MIKFVKTPSVKVFSTDKIREIDAYTIQNEPIASIDLMERAAQHCSDWIGTYFTNKNEILIFCGPGNNGGDGLAIARQLSIKGFQVNVYIISTDNRTSEDFNINYTLLSKIKKIKINTLKSKEDIPSIRSNTMVIDAIFGSGLSRPADGFIAELIRKINSSGATVIAIDIPSGLFGEDNRKNNPDAIIKATHTLTFQFPKLAFFYADNNIFTGHWHILPIGLHSEAIDNIYSEYYYVDQQYAAGL